MLHGFQRSFKTFWRKFQAGAFQSVEEKPQDFLKESQLLSNLKAAFRGWVGGCDPPQGGACQGPPCVKSQHKIRKDWRNKNKSSWSLEPVKVFQLDQLNVLYLNIISGWWQLKYFWCSSLFGGNDPNLTCAYVSNGLVKNTPTSDDMTFPTWNSHKNQAWQCRWIYRSPVDPMGLRMII